MGIIREALNWGGGGLQFKTMETTCIARGDPTCNFAIYKEPVG
jgi:hypothetical protein